jgi:hypothetical protein
MKKFYLSLLTLSLCISGSVLAQNLYSQDFEDVPAMLSSGGWTQQNNSIPLGFEIWHNEDGNGLAIDAYNGTPFSCAVASFLSTDSSGSGNISNWLITPTLNLNNGDVVSFYTTSYNNSFYPDRLQLRLNTHNTTYVGAADTSVGDFTILLLDINSGLNADTSEYPEDYWGQFTVTISGLSGPTDCALAFRYFVNDGGVTGTNSSTIGIDAFSVDRPVGINELANGIALNVFPNPTSGKLHLSFGSGKINKKDLSVIDLAGQIVFHKELSPSELNESRILDLSELSKGMYILHVQNEANEQRNMRIIID